MNRVPGSTTLLLPSNVYPKRNASPKRHIQQIVITQSTTTFAQSAAHHQNNQHRQNHFNVLNSLEGTPEKVKKYNELASNLILIIISRKKRDSI